MDEASIAEGAVELTLRLAFASFADGACSHPRTWRRCEVLCSVGGYFASRQAHRLTYASQSLDRLQRRHRASAKIEARFNGASENGLRVVPTVSGVFAAGNASASRSTSLQTNAL